ncbi:hypothetical protein [Photobacterium kishitanii]|uniref:hypothetical protein n=1 Tax=Photobacterium kishitanii TaxID=318456 RepID=UPI000D164BAC|nr:hypothetical protein [Photobacterium kishitanii]PSU20603.1 hypothetical protein CTM84_12340 [Photobacterium kishitanii]
MAKNPPTSHFQSPTKFNYYDALIKQEERTQKALLAKEVRARKDLDILARIDANKHSLKYDQMMNNISGNGLFIGQCTLQEELEKNHQAVLLLTEEDTFYTLKNMIEARYHKNGEIPSTLILKDIDKAKTWAEYLATGFGAVKLTQAFGDFGVTARYSVINGKTRVSIATRNNGQQMLRHVLVNGMRLKLNGTKTYAIDNPKVLQLGLAPKQRINAGIKAGAMTMIISAAINTNNLIFNNDYDFYDWFGDVGTDFIKTAIALYGAEIVIGAIIGLSGSVAIVAIAVISILITLAVDDLFEVKNVSGELTNALRKLQS